MEERHGARGDAAEWGLAALISAGVMLLLAGTTVVASLQLEQLLGPGSAGGLGITRTLAVAGVAIAAALDLAALGLGLRAQALASAEGRTSGLALAGTVLSIGALAAWVVAGVALFQVLG